MPLPLASSPVPLLAMTGMGYSQALFERLGKGRDHALHLYRQFWRLGGRNGLRPLFDHATSLHEQLCSETDFHLPELRAVKELGDARKLLIATEDGFEVESVLLPMQHGITLCISSQVGCSRACRFCETGRMGLLRQLRTDEMVAQLFLANQLLAREGEGELSASKVDNLVFMGMGEPMDNYDAVIGAVRIATDLHATAMSQRSITLSTSGVIEGIEKLSREKDVAVNLAVSLSAASDAKRNWLMPINRRYPLKELYKAIVNYTEKSGKGVMIAYVMIDSINDSLEEAEELAAYLRGLQVKVNLIPYNPQSRDPFAPSSAEQIDQFAAVLRDKGYKVLLRHTKGRAIQAGCGQLGNVALRRTKA